MYQPTITDSDMLSWESQYKQFPEYGQPGFSREAVFTPQDKVTIPWNVLTAKEKKEVIIECFLFRDSDGKLRGILYYYLVDMPSSELERILHAPEFWERAGNFNLYVDPEYQRKGIGSELLMRAEASHEINFDQQRWSESGSRFINNYLRGPSW